MKLHDMEYLVVGQLKDLRFLYTVTHVGFCQLFSKGKRALKNKYQGFRTGGQIEHGKSDGNLRVEVKCHK